MDTTVEVKAFDPRIQKAEDRCSEASQFNRWTSRTQINLVLGGG